MSILLSILTFLIAGISASTAALLSILILESIISMFQKKDIGSKSFIDRYQWIKIVFFVLYSVFFALALYIAW